MYRTWSIISFSPELYTRSVKSNHISDLTDESGKTSCKLHEEGTRDGLQSLENLQKLNVSGNLIGSIDALRCLSALEKLTSLRVCDKASGLTNPMCNSSYSDEVLVMLPILLNLDGERVRGRGSELFQLCQGMDSALKNLSSIKQTSEINIIDPPKRAMIPDLPLVQKRNATVPIVEAEVQLRELLTNCRKVCEEAHAKFNIGTDVSLATFKGSES
ncbi:leucine-rich repeat-containing protein 61 [Elysia marginata]|uniref:Leucine-rich repeat-containing protein 61 n=1 Tax=Elysia marginata TaxID=1093978 RepID=A0AAV4J1F7_9GAST|nr:leucine-rich repeat-containing protein 61 [Elysia marginata]